MSRRARRRAVLSLLIAMLSALLGTVATTEGRSHLRDVIAVTGILLDTPRQERSHADSRSQAGEVLRAARMQMGVRYVLGARPRHRWALELVGSRRMEATGLDCSTFVAWAFLEGTGMWLGGTVAHTDEIWTQGRTLPIEATAARTDRVLRGTLDTPPPGGFRTGDLVFLRSGAGGYWGHVAIVSEAGLVIESFPPDVHEERSLEQLAASEPHGGWMRFTKL